MAPVTKDSAMLRRPLLAAAFILSSASAAHAGLASIPIGNASFTPTGPVPCTQGAGGRLACDEGVAGVKLTRVAPDAVRFTDAGSGTSVQIEGVGLVVERGTFANGKEGIRISGQVAQVRTAQLTVDGPMTVTSMAPRSRNDGGHWTVSIDIIETGVSIDIIATGIAGDPPDRIVFDDAGVVLGSLLADGWRWGMMDGAGVTKLAAAAGVVRFDRGGTLRDPSGSASVAVIDGLPGWRSIAVAGDGVYCEDWDMDLRPAPGPIAVSCLGGQDWDFALQVFQRPLHTAVIAGTVYSLAD